MTILSYFTRFFHIQSLFCHISGAVNALHTSARRHAAHDVEFNNAKDRLSALKEDPGNQVKLQIYALFKQVYYLVVQNEVYHINICLNIVSLQLMRVCLLVPVVVSNVLHSFPTPMHYNLTRFSAITYLIGGKTSWENNERVSRRGNSRKVYCSNII